MEFHDGRSGVKQVLFSRDNVFVSIPGPVQEEITFVGILAITKQSHGIVIEWHSKRPATSDLKSNNPDNENVEFGDFTVVGYKAKPDSSKAETEDKKPPPKEPRPIRFDLADAKSFKRCQVIEGGQDSRMIATFFLKDGTGIPSFTFRNHQECFTFFVALEKHVSLRRSSTDPTIYLINDPDTVEMKKSFSGLNLFDDERPAGFSQIFKDPYALMNKFSKVTNLWLNVNDPGARNGYEAEDVAEIINETHNCIQIEQGEADYEVVTCFVKPSRESVKREDPVTPEEWHTYIDSEGRFHNVGNLKRRIFKGGLINSLRSEAWKYLLGFYDFNSTTKEREAKRKLKIDEYYRMKLQWKSISADQESRFSALRDRRNIIEKDVSRTDRTHPFFEGENNASVQMLYDILMTYCMYNFDLGYVQGMSDLLSPILVVMQIESDAFWCFASWMEVIGVNFEMSQQEMKTQLLNMGRLLHFIDNQFSLYLDSHESGNLYFAFRWVLILFKRDFKFEEAMRLWEVLWTGLPCKNFHLLVCLAILDIEKTAIVENNYGLTEILKHVNDMAYKLHLEETLSVAEAIYNQICGCSKVPDTVQTILGLELEDEPDEASSSAVTGRTSEKEVTSNDASRRIKSTCSTDEYVNIEEQCLLSFGLFS